MRGPTLLFTIFIAIAALVVVGVAVLPGLTATYGTAGPGATMPRPLAALWLAWMFALWGSLVAVILAVIAWAYQQLAASERAGEPRYIHVHRGGGAERTRAQPSSPEHLSRATVATSSGPGSP